ncbi:MAG: DUF1028 domain-containing protein [Bryobacteraceae bacterium]
MTTTRSAAGKLKATLILLVATALQAAENVSTFSVVGFDPATREWGIAVASKYFSVGSVVPWAEAEVGAIATQANVNVGYGSRGLELLRQGLTAKQTLDRLLSEDKFEGKDGRQVAIIDSKGNIAAYTGPKAPNWAGDRQGKTWSAQGNILVGSQVPEAMGKAFEATGGELAEKLFEALKAGDDAGGDSRGRQSASMLVVREGGGRNTNNNRTVYINIDDHPFPIPELRHLLDLDLGYLYQDKAFKYLSSGKIKDARDAAEKVTHYMPGRPEAHLTFGLLSYLADDKSAALTALNRAAQRDPDFRKHFDTATHARPAYKPILGDKEFLRELFPESR